MLTVALSKGRLLKDFIKFIDENGNSKWADALNNRERKLQIEVANVRFILVKGNDVSTYVEEGIADIGITGSDILDEKDKLNVNNLVDLPFGYCHFAVASKPEVTEYKKSRRLMLKRRKRTLKIKDKMSQLFLYQVLLN